MSDTSGSNRRDFLTGRATQRELRRRADEVTDAILDGDEVRTAPQAHDTIRLETRAMACQWAVVMNPGPPRQVMIASDALDEVHVVEDELTVYRDNSVIARVNQLAADHPQKISTELLHFLEHCATLWRETEGAFDPAMGALIRLWRAARQIGKIPTQSEVDDALTRTGWRNLRLDTENETVQYDVPGLLLDFGAIGKGEAIDRAVNHLLAEEQADFLLHGGQSSLAARGNHGGHRGWPIGIKNPLFTDRRYATLLLRDQAMSTSGSNVQFFRHGGQRYGHILDPRNGWPAQGLLSVTVVCPSAADADALSTAFYVMGLDKARRYCDDHQDVGAILIPAEVRGRKLEPIVLNLPQEQLFFESDE